MIRTRAQSKPKGHVYSARDDDKIEKYAASGWSVEDIGASFYPPKSKDSIRCRRGIIGVAKGDARNADSYNWTDEEERILDDGINKLGWSWDELARAMPRRRMAAIKNHAIKAGLARKMPGAYPQIPDDNIDEVAETYDPLLEKLREVHGEDRQ